ncbi:hypothetical protein CEXT_538471 [Caerostris extrusa]|uniref:Uncharacterized protein n=1 Tax=Caerostris extrusa TaxID=172846 RepID=A0AAV4MGG1_CAEEX|nr:hypothetical protein CEXT_538471 [Caerostris extrusa]
MVLNSENSINLLKTIYVKVNSDETGINFYMLPLKTKMEKHQFPDIRLAMKRCHPDEEQVEIGKIKAYFATKCDFLTQPLGHNALQSVLESLQRS